MGANTSPSDEEIDRFEELYAELGSVKAVSNHDDVDWSAPTVSKWLKRRGVMGDGSSGDGGGDSESSTDSEPEPAPEPAGEPVEGDYVAEPEPEQSIEEQFSDILEDEPPSPNDILWDVLATDPDIKDKHVDYLRRFEDQYGVFSPDDVSGKLNELKITNKRMTINRVVSNYRTEINRKLQKDQDLAKKEEWALLLTKTTGDPRYLREAEGGGSVGQFEQAGPSIAGPGGRDQPAQDQIQAPAPGGQQNQYGQQQGQQPGQRPQQTNGARGAPQRNGQQVTPPSQPVGAGGQQQGGEQALDPFQERLLEMLEQQMDDGDDTAPTPTSESDSLSSQIEEIAQIQKTLDDMGGGDGNNEELTQAIQQINEQVDQKLARLEAKVSEMDSGGNQTPVPTGGGGEGGGTMSEIAALAQQIEDPDVLSTVIESQMDPEVIKAKAETEEVENDAQFKRALAEALSPAATEKAVEALSNLTSGINTAAQAAGQPQQPRQQQPQQPQQGGAQSRGVEVVDEGQTTQEEPAMSNPSEATEESSPLREQGEEELSETDTPEGDEETEE